MASQDFRRVALLAFLWSCVLTVPFLLKASYSLLADSINIPYFLVLPSLPFLLVAAAGHLKHQSGGYRFRTTLLLATVFTGLATIAVFASTVAVVLAFDNGFGAPIGLGILMLGLPVGVPVLMISVWQMLAQRQFNLTDHKA